MKILLAGPGTGKTTKVKDIINTKYPNANNILILSFTNATITDLKDSFKDFNNVNCYTLHGYALKINHLPALHVLDDFVETPIISRISEKLNFKFDDICSFLKCITFSKMIEKCIDFIRVNPAYVSEKIGKLDLLVVDEFQDFNAVERELVFLLARYSNDAIILGDDDQSIYDFKDADPDGIIALYKDEGVDKLDHENICYRCPDTIVEYCSNLISHNQHRIGKDWKKSNKVGDVIFEQTLTQADTHEYICRNVKASLENGKTVLVLSPVGFYVPDLKQQFDNEHIPYVDFWIPRLSNELKEKIWWLKALYGEHRIAFLIFLADSLKLFAKKRFTKILKQAFQNNFDIAQLIVDIGKYYPKPFADYLLAPIGISEFWTKHEDFRELRDHIDETDLFASIGSLEKSLKPVLMFDDKSVNLMSIHKSKGLQADHVFITGLSEGILPNAVRGVDTIEAQRRLLFVGMTRALEKLYLISTVEWDGKFVQKVDKNQFKYQYQKKKYHSKTSHFLEEIKV